MKRVFLMAVQPVSSPSGRQIQLNFGNFLSNEELKGMKAINPMSGNAMWGNALILFLSDVEWQELPVKWAVGDEFELKASETGLKLERVK